MDWTTPPRIAMLALSLACAPVASNSGRSGSPRVELSPEARAYLATALDSIRAVTLRGDTISWPAIRDSAFQIANGAQRPIDTYAAIDWALRRANKHSFLQVPTPGATSVVVHGRFGYLHVPQRGGAAVPLADSLHSAIGRMREQGVCGWVVDVRANGGGNMWPMLAGVGPLLGDTIVGSFGTGPSAQRWYYKAGSSGIVRADGTLEAASRVTVPVVEMLSVLQPVAVLMDSGTGSSGEAVAVAFRGRPATRSFGTPTAGFATVNRGLRLSDGANMVVTVGYYADRAGTVYGDRLTPDVRVRLPVGWPSPTDAVASAAIQWLQSQQGCS